jgi:hypothetical protein
MKEYKKQVYAQLASGSAACNVAITGSCGTKGNTNFLIIVIIITLDILSCFGVFRIRCSGS